MQNRLNNNNKFKQGKFLSEDFIGYAGKKSYVELLSSYEFKAVKLLQQMYQVNRIKGWASEESIFEYYSDTDMKLRKYYMDFTILKDNRVIFVEVKPHAETIPPRKPKTFKNEKQKINYQNKVKTFIVNQNKWAAVQEWCKNHNLQEGYEKYSFVIWDEKTLGI